MTQERGNRPFGGSRHGEPRREGMPQAVPGCAIQVTCLDLAEIYAPVDVAGLHEYRGFRWETPRPTCFQG